MHLPSFRNNHHRGFTLVEMLVIAPIAIITIAILVSLMVGLVGQTMLSTDRSSTTFNTQDALDRIEQDTKVSGAFLTTYNSVTAPQGRNGSTESFDTSKGDIIMSQQATTANPYNNTRQLVYFQNQPNPCSNATANRVLPVRIVYFTLSDGAGTNTLWRRTLMYGWNTSATPDGSTVCNAPWQRNSCPLTSTLNNTPCQAYDEKILENVSSFTTQYLLSNGATTTDPTLAKTILVSLGSQRKVAGKQLVNTMSLRVTRGADIPVPPTPGTPTISVLNPAVQDYNNPILTTFQWSASSAEQYLYTYQINGGAWSTPISTVSTSAGIPTPYSNVTINLKVTALNAGGSSATAQLSYQTPLWTNITLNNNWQWWGAFGATSHTTPQYTLTSAGLLLMKGMLSKNQTQGNVNYELLFRLPTGLTPDTNLILPATSYSTLLTPARLDIRTTGEVYATGGTYYLSLDAANFYPPSTGNSTRTAFTPSSGWLNYGSGFSPMYYITDASTVSGATNQRIGLQGLVNRNGSSTYSPVLSGIPSIGASGAHIPVLGDAGPGPALAGTNISGTTANERTTGMSWVSYQAIYFRDTTAGWSTPTFSGDWSAYGNGWMPPGYIIASDKVVSLRGLIKKASASNGETLYTLPSGYRPAQTLFTMVYTYNATTTSGVLGVVYINTNGAISAYGTSLNSGWVSLDNINFYADGS